MTLRKTPTFWLEFTTRAYPGGSPGSDDTLRMSTTPLAFPTMIEGRVKRGGWGPIEYALSDWKGNPEASTVTADCEDSDGRLRAITESMGVSAYAKAETSVKFLSEAGRHAGLTPRIIHRGYLRGSPKPLPNRKARIEAVDAASSQWFHLDPAAPLQKVFWSRAWLEAAGYINTPKDLFGKPVNIVLGEHSDLGTLDANGADASKGMVPVDYVGDQATVQPPTIPPPILSISRVGAAGSSTFHYAVSAITATGETVWSNVVTITDSLPNGSRDASNYNRLTWTAPSGYESVYADLVIAYRVGGRSTNPPTTYLDIQNNGGTFVSPETFYNDGEIAGRDELDIEKQPPAPAVGTAVTDPSWGLLVWALGYAPLTRVYGSDVAEGTEPKRVLLDPDDPDLKTPLSANWDLPNPWIELTLPTGGTVRVSGFFAKGVLLQQHKDRVVTFAVSTCGVTDTGDDTGTPITEASEGYLWVLNELALKNGGAGYRTGTFWPLETFSDGTSVLNTTIIRAFQAATARFIGGRGYQMHLCLTETTTVSQFEQWYNTTFTSYTGQLENGQRGVWVIDDESDPTTWRHFRHRIEIAASLPEPVIAEDEVENLVEGKCDWDPDAQAYRGEVITLEDLDSQAMYGLCPAAPTGQVLEGRCTRDPVTFRDALARRLKYNKVAPLYQPLDTALLGIEQSLGAGLRLTHPDGIGVDGYQNRAFFTVRKRIDPNGPDQRVTLTARDIHRHVTTTGQFADDTVPAFPDATPAQQATFWAWTNDDGTIPTGATGAQWR